jgi:hypothetical protein
VKAEYLYVDLGSQSSTITYTYGTNVSTLTSNLNERDNIVRVGVNYMFHWRECRACLQRCDLELGRKSQHHGP